MAFEAHDITHAVPEPVGAIDELKQGAPSRYRRRHSAVQRHSRDTLPAGDEIANQLPHWRATLVPGWQIREFALDKACEWLRPERSGYRDMHRVMRLGWLTRRGGGNRGHALIVSEPREHTQATLASVHWLSMNVFMVIPVHDRLDYTRACLDSLREQRFRDFRVIVVDDGSTDGTHAAVSDEFPEVTLLWGDGDLWWTGAMNKGLEWVLPRAASDDLVLALNNDTVVPPDYLHVLIEQAERHPQALIGSVAVSVHDRERIVDGGVRIDWRTGRSTKLAEGLTPSQALSKWGELTPVSVLSGRGTLVPAEVFRQVGLYDQRRLPHYGADWEFARRAQRAGFPLLLSYRVPVFSHDAATGVRPSVQTLSLVRFLSAYVDVRSPNNLRYRWNFARLCTEPGALPAFFAADVVRVVGGGARRQVVSRLRELLNVPDS